MATVHPGIGSKPLRVEAFRLGEKLRQTLGRVGARNHQAAARDRYITDPIVFRRRAGDDPGRWIESLRLLQHLAGQRQLIQLVESQRSIAEGNEFLL